MIIPALLLSLSALSCSDSTLTDYGDPPSPETTFCDYDGIEIYLEWAADNYTGITELREIGSSEAGRPLYAIEISDNPGSTEAEPAVLIAGAIHGHEQASAGVALKLLEHLLTAYSTGNTAIVDIVENYKIHIIPVINPDGLESSDRYNQNGVDINRNFGYNWYENEISNGDEAFDQAESSAMRDDFLAHSYSLALVLHTATSNDGMGIYGPWDAIPSSTADFETQYLPNYGFIETLGEAYADEVVADAGYPFAQNFHYEEGADWYPLYGSLNDWALGTKGTVCYSVELYGKQDFTTWDDYLLEDIWNANMDAMLEIITKSSLGTGGRLLDSYGYPLADATISLSETGGRLFEPQPYTELKGITDDKGYFRFLTAEGNYHISFSSSAGTFEADISVNAAGETDAGSGYELFPDFQIP